jgi:hypothetical protein
MEYVFRGQGQLRCPVLLMHGSHYTVVPVENPYRLQATAGSVKVQLNIRPSRHDSMDAFLDEMPRITAFLRRFYSQQA